MGSILSSTLLNKATTARRLVQRAPGGLSAQVFLDLVQPLFGVHPDHVLRGLRQDEGNAVIEKAQLLEFFDLFKRRGIGVWA